jgi:hypothetical protein
MAYFNIFPDTNTVQFINSNSEVGSIFDNNKKNI